MCIPPIYVDNGCGPLPDAQPMGFDFRFPKVRSAQQRAQDPLLNLLIT